MASYRYKGDAEAYRRSLDNPEQAVAECKKHNVKERKKIPRRRLREKPAVGYCSPPIETRWRPGQSGNPRGRPKGTRNLRNTFVEILTKKIAFREGDKVRRVTMLEAVLIKRLQLALKGDHRAIQGVYTFAASLGLLEERPQKIILGNNLDTLTDDELSKEPLINIGV